MTVRASLLDVRRISVSQWWAASVRCRTQRERQTENSTQVSVLVVHTISYVLNTFGVCVSFSPTSSCRSATNCPEWHHHRHHWAVCGVCLSVLASYRAAHHKCVPPPVPFRLIMRVYVVLCPYKLLSCVCAWTMCVFWRCRVNVYTIVISSQCLIVIIGMRQGLRARCFTMIIIIIVISENVLNIYADSCASVRDGVLCMFW